MAIHCRLSAILGEKRMKMIECSRLSGVSNNTIVAMYHDRVTKVNYSVLNRLCEALECNVSDLLVHVPDKKTDQISQ